MNISNLELEEVKIYSYDSSHVRFANVGYVEVNCTIRVPVSMKHNLAELEEDQDFELQCDCANQNLAEFVLAAAREHIELGQGETQ